MPTKFPATNFINWGEQISQSPGYFKNWEIALFCHEFQETNLYSGQYSAKLDIEKLQQK